MTTKHTPGPWKIGALESGQAAVDGADGSEVTGFVSIPDASLIAAAPDLLDALEEYHRVANAVPYAQWTPAMHKAQDAIAKAKGKV
jgi:hypothetical protein